MRKFLFLLCAMLLLFCGFTALSECDHSYDMADVKMPSCTQDGYYILKCTKCGDTKKEITDEAYGHAWEMVASKPADCTETGYTEYECQNCGDVHKETFAKLGHNWQDSHVLEEATCTSDGTMRTVCTRCGLSGSRTLEKGHDFGSWNTTTAPTDHTKGEKTRVCRHCGKKETESFYPEGTLYKDIQNKRNEVSQIQRLLTDMGYLNDKIDGIFGKKTESAVKAFQADFGFKTDGIAWPQTIQRLNSAWNTQFGPPESPESGSPEPGASASAFCYLLILDDGTEYWDTCDAHSEIFYNATMNINGDLSESDVLMLLEEAWLQELDLLYASLIELSPAEEQPLITNNKTFFYGYLNTQRTLWNDQYGENSVEALSLVLDAIMLQGHSLCQSVYLLNQ